jgi:hypothetical protein
MFIRFFTSAVDQRSQVSAGLFCAAAQLRQAEDLPEYEHDALQEIRGWFNDNLESPLHYLPRGCRYDRAICWFKATAHEHLARAWELAALLERNDILIWTIKSSRTGYIRYEDEAQVFAEPYDDVRALFRR